MNRRLPALLVSLLAVAALARAGEAGKRPVSVSGVVVSPTGEPVDGAEVIVSTPNHAAWPNVEPENRVPHRGGAAAARTDKDGRFNVDVRQDAGLLSAHHPKIGYAEVNPDALSGRGDSQVKLEPWCRIEGVLKIGAKPAPAGTKVSLGTFGWTAFASRVHYGYDTTTDAEGRYVLDRVPAGLAQIRARVSKTGSPIEQYVGARPDKPTRFDTGGAGRPVVGKLVLTGDLDIKQLGKRDGLYSSSYFRRDVPWPDEPVNEADLNDEDSEAALRAWRKTDQAIEAYKNEYRCNVVFAADGTFRFDDVPAGKYILTISIHRPGGVGQSFAQVVDEKHEVVVPAAAPALPSDQPLDLGEIKTGSEGL